MILCPAQPFDIPAVMTIEHNAFIPQIQEKRRVFDARLQLFPQGFFVLVDTSDTVIQEHGSALTAGYFTSELWSSVPVPQHDQALEAGVVPVLQPKLEKALTKQFALGHKMHATHQKSGSVLYVSSVALLQQYRGRGLGEAFFRASLSALCGAQSHIQSVVLLVNEEWQSARRMYDALGFVPLYALPEFFPSLHGKRADGIVMKASADAFRSASLVTNKNGAVVI